MPSLPDDKLKAVLDQVQGLPIDEASKRVLADSLRAASNPNNERIDVVMKTLEPIRRKMIEKTAKGLRSLNAETMARGKERLEAISDDEWQRLIDDSTNG